MNEAPTNEPVGGGWTPEWKRWLKLVQLALSSWSKPVKVETTIDFGLVLAHNELGSSPITVRGARPLDIVLVAAEGNLSGLTYKGVVTANDQVTVYAVNSTTSNMNPGSMQFRIIVLQN